MDDEGVAEALAIDEQRLHHVVQRVEVQVRHRERHLDLQDVPERAEAGVQQDVADLGEHLARRRVHRQRERRLAGEQLLEHAGGLVVEDQERVAGDRAGEDLVDARDLILHDPAQGDAELLDGVDRHLRHFEEDPVAGQLRERRRGASEADVQQLDERVMLGWRQFHGALPAMTFSMTSITYAGCAGLLMKPEAPAAFTISRDEVWMSADITTTRAAGSISRIFESTSSPYMPLMRRSSSTTSGRSMANCSSAERPSSASTTVYPTPSRNRRVTRRVRLESSTSRTLAVIPSP